MRRRLFLAVIGLGGAAILIGLGIWQIQRLGWKQSILSQIDTRIDGPATALPAQPNSASDAYLPVNANGTLEPGALHVLVSVKDIGAGYRVIAPFVLPDGHRIMADLGFIPAEAKARAQPSGPALLTGNLQWPQEVDGFTPAPDLARNIWFARDVPAMAAALNADPVLLVVRHSNPPDAAITPMPIDTALIPNDHLQYAITWFSLAAIWLAMSFAFLRRRAPKTES